MPIAVSKTGDVVTLVDGRWLPAKIATDAQGNRMAFADGQWMPVQKKDYTWGEVGPAAVEHLGSSAKQFGKDIVQPFLHPVETGKALYKVGKGGLQEAGIVGGEEDKEYFNAVGSMLHQRYGSMENLRRTMAEDPVGFASDMSAFLSGGGGLAAKTASAAGKLADVAGAAKTAAAAEKVAGAASKVSKAGRAIDPVNVATTFPIQASKIASEGVVQVLGRMTGTSADSVREAFASGATVWSRPTRAKAWRDQFTNAKSPADIYHMAQTAVSNMIRERGGDYQKAMQALGADKTVLDFQKIDDAIIDSLKVGVYEGEVIDQAAANVRILIEKEVMRWRQLAKQDPTKFATPVGLDALKKDIQSIRDLPENTNAFGRPTRAGIIAEDVAKAIVKTIEDQAPQYADIMRKYAQQSDLIDEIQKELSLGNNSNAGMALRKLQSTIKSNVSTAFKHRGDLAQVLMDHGAPDLWAAISGGMLQEWTPRGLGLAAGAGVTASMGLAHGVAPGVAALAASSPKVVGGAMHGAGVAASPFYEAHKRISPLLKKRIPGTSQTAPELAKSALRQARLRGAYLPKDPISGEDQSELTGPKIEGVHPGVDVAVRPFREGLPAPATKSQLEALPPPATPPGGAEDTPSSLGIRG